MSSCNWLASWQIVNTLVPYAALWWLAVLCLQRGSWWLLAVQALMVLFLARCFSLMHDCGHYSLFRSRTANRWVGFLLGIVTGIPQLPWSRGHAFHHRHNGNWERYKGPSGLVSVATYNGYTDRGKALYRLLRHPLMLVPGGFFYLVIKPRVELVAGLMGLLPHALRVWRETPGLPWRQVVASHSSRWWHSPEEFRDLLLNNVAVVASWWAMAAWIGAGPFWLIYAPVMAFSAAIFICIFFVQHNFPGAYAHSTNDWDAMDGVMEGTSNLELPAVLNWFSADIACHAIHHLCESIPNYRLQACQRHNAHLLKGVKRLKLGDIPGCFPYILWDEEAGTLTTAASLQAS